MKKVLLISHFPPPAGGIASWTKRLLAIGLPNGWKIDHINSNTINGRDPFQNVKRSFKDEYVRSMSIWKQEKEFLKKDKDIQVVHTCIPCTVFGMIRETITGMIAKKYNKKFILHCRCTVPNVVNSGFKRLFWRILTSYCDGIMVLNSKSEIFAKKYSKKSYVELIPNFVAASELTFDENKQIKKTVENITYVGGVTAQKGCEIIVEAAKEFKDITFNLIGIVSKEIEELDAPQNVVFHGNHPTEYVKEQLKQADVFLFLSKYWGEGFSNALVEAQAAGLPCIVTDWAAAADQIENKGGIVIEEQDADDLIEAIRKIKDDTTFRESASKWNVEKVKSSYIDSVILDKYTKFYEKLI